MRGGVSKVMLTENPYAKQSKRQLGISSSDSFLEDDEAPTLSCNKKAGIFLYSLVTVATLLFGAYSYILSRTIISSTSSLSPSLDFTFSPSQCYITSVSNSPFESKLCSSNDLPYDATDNACVRYYFQCYDVYTPTFYHGAALLRDRGKDAKRAEVGKCDFATTPAPNPFVVTSCNKPFPRDDCPGVGCWVSVPGRQVNRAAYSCSSPVGGVADDDSCVKLYDPSLELERYEDSRRVEAAKWSSVAIGAFVAGGGLATVALLAVGLCADCLGIRCWRGKTFAKHYRDKKDKAKGGGGKGGRDEEL